MKTWSVVNAKGGVGKTVTSISLASILPELTKKTVLLVDLDPQAHSTIGLGVDPSALEYTIGDVLLNRLDLVNAIQETNIDGLDLVPSNIKLAKASEELYAKTYRESLLSKALDEVKRKYSHIIIDCPPSLSVLTVNAIHAADRLLVPCAVSRYSLDGLADLLDLITEIKGAKDPAKLIRILLTMYDRRTKVTNEIVLDQLSPFKDRLLKTRIHRCEALNQSSIIGETIHTFSPSSEGSKNYKQLAKEIMK